MNSIIALKNIPYWIKKSQIFEHFLDFSQGNLDEEFPFDNCFIRETDNIENFNDFKEVIKVISFWNMMITDSVFNFIFDKQEGSLNNFCIFINQYEQFKTECSGLTYIWEQLDLFLQNGFTRVPTLNLIIEISHLGFIDALKYVCKYPFESNDQNLIDELNNSIKSEKPCIEAVSKGNVEVLKYLISIGSLINEEVVYWAAITDNIQCLGILKLNNCTFTEKAFIGTIFFDKIDAFIYLHNLGCPWSVKTCNKAVINSNPEFLLYAITNGCPYDENTTMYAASYDNVDCLKILYENNCPRNKTACNAAAQNGKLRALKYLHETGAPWDSHVCYFASINGFIDCLNYALENGCPPYFSQKTLNTHKRILYNI